MERGGPDERLAALAAKQHAVFTRSQARRCGLSEAAIRHRLLAGRWSVLEPGTYAIAGVPDRWEARVMSSVLASGPGAAASHVTAAVLWGLRQGGPDIVDVTVSHDRHHGRHANRIVHRARTLGRANLRNVAGIRVTCPARTIVDVAGVLRPEELEAVLDAALLRGSLSIDSLRRYKASRHLTSRRGMGSLSRLLDDRQAGIPESQLERDFLRLVRRARLPRPTPQYRVGRRRLDFAYPEVRVGIELDGFANHGSLTAFREDRRRQNALVLDGWSLLRFTWDDVHKHPGEVTDILRTALRRGGSQP